MSPSDSPGIPFDIRISESGRGNILIDGESVESHVVAVDVHAVVGEIPRVVLYMQGGVEILGIGGILQISPRLPSELVGQLNIQEIEDRALATFGWDNTGSIASKVVQVIQEMLCEIESGSSEETQ